MAGNEPEARIGIGHDLHRLGANRPLRVGGVVIPHPVGLEGHSDADVLLHAITDALLGATAQGDIGEWFPDSDPVNRDRDSAQMLEEVLARTRGVRIINLDCTVFAQEPKLGPYKRVIRRRLAEILHVPEDRVNVKAKTGEGVGPVGRGEALAAQAALLIEIER